MALSQKDGVMVFHWPPGPGITTIANASHETVTFWFPTGPVRLAPGETLNLMSHADGTCTPAPRCACKLGPGAHETWCPHWEPY